MRCEYSKIVLTEKLYSADLPPTFRNRPSADLPQPTLKVYYSNMQRETFVITALVSSLSLIGLAPMVPFIHEQMMWWIIGLLLLLCAAALTKKNKFDAKFTAILTAIFLGSLLVYQDVEQRLLAIRVCAITSLVLLNLVLLIGPWSRFLKKIEKIYKHRRHLGVTVFLLGLMHFSLLFGPYFDYSFANAFASIFTFFGFTALFVMFFMAITSWDWAQKHIAIRQWRQLHTLTLVLYLATLAYAIWVNLDKNLTIQTWQYLLFATFIIFWVIVAPWGLAPKIFQFVNGWKQLHVLIYVAYAALIVHAWEGLFVAQPLPVQLIFWGLIAAVVISHGAGWIIKWQQDKALKQDEACAEIITIEDLEYRSAGHIEEYQENVGKKILVKGLPVAVFKFKDAFYAWFAICGHQKGPLERGKIVKGYLTCPWHQWQYSLKDGCGPVGFADCVPFYPTAVKDGKVYVALLPRRRAILQTNHAPHDRYTQPN